MAPDKDAIELHGSLWITVGGENFGGRGRIGLLARVAEYGSIAQAAKSIKMSYKAAWDAIDRMNNLAGEPLVERLSGGKGGGGTRVTRRGEQLIENFRLIEMEHRHFLAQLSGQSQTIADDLMLIKRLNMKTSARNQLPGKVSRITRGALNDEVEIEIAGKQGIVATIAHASSTELGLQPGLDVFALINAASIIIMTDGDGEKISARNRLTGTVCTLQPDAVNTEIVITLADGAEVAALLTNASCHALGLAVGASASAVFKASSVILGIPV